MKSATPVVTPALARNEDDDEHEVTTEKTESLGECWAHAGSGFGAADYTTKRERL